jgi:hypothetical protein
MIRCDCFRQREIKQQCVCKTKTSSKQKRNCHAPTTQNAANSRAKNKAETKGSAQQSHSFRAIFPGRNVRHIGLGRRYVSTGDAIKNAAEKKHPKCCGKTKDQEADSGSDN